MVNLRNSVLLLVRIPLLLALNCSIGFGSDWSEINTGLDDTNIRMVSVDPTNPAIVYAGSDGGLYRSVNGGVTWGNLGLTRVRSLAIDFTNPNILYAGTEIFSGIGDRMLFKSIDGGMTWSNRRSPTDYDFSLIAMDPTDSKTLYIASYLSYCCAGGAVLFRKTVDGGETWVNPGFTHGIELGCCTLAIDPINPQNLFLPGVLYESGAAVDYGLMKSTDGGFSWSPTALINSVTPLFHRYHVNLVANDSKNSLYAATYAWSTGVTDFNGFTGLFKSSDGGKSWHPINTGLLNIGNESRITAIVIDPDDANVVYAATGGYRDGQGVFKSIDGGKNWTLFNDGLGGLNIRSLALTPGSPNVLYAGTSAGVFKIIDGPIVTLNENAYCVGSPWSLTVTNTRPETSVHLLGTSNDRSWEVRDWRKTAPDGTKHENGAFAAGTEGTHYLRVEVDGMLSNVLSFVVSNCRPLVPAYGP